MESIGKGASGAAVEDIQERLTRLGYEIDEAETGASSFGDSTASATERFRVDHGIARGDEIDNATWAALVDETYTLGDRTLYLRLPTLHGRDVRDLQTRLNILGFSCGEPDGCYGAYTESAVKQFQENVGILPDGMAFQDTFDAIERLRHVWAGNPAKGPHPMGDMGFARAAKVLEERDVALTGEDPIARNVAGRIWNLACATSDNSRLTLVNSPKEVKSGAVIVLGTSELPKKNRIANVIIDDTDLLPDRIRTAYESTRGRKRQIRVELPCSPDLNGTFTTSDAQTFAVILLDAICAAFA